MNAEEKPNRQEENFGANVNAVWKEVISNYPLSRTLIKKPFIHKCSLDAQKLQQCSRARVYAAVASTFISRTGLHLLFIKHYGQGFFRLLVFLALAIVVISQAISNYLPLPVLLIFLIIEIIVLTIIEIRANIERWTLIALLDPEEARKFSEKASVVFKKRGSKKADIIIALAFAALVIGIVLFVYYQFKN